MMLEKALPAAIGYVDASGSLVRADNRLADLNRQAGGDIGKPIAVPQLATLARLALRLGIVISRKICAADGGSDIELWVRAEPEGDALRLEVSGWHDRGDWNVGEEAPRERDFMRADADWLWETDASLHITSLSQQDGAKYGFDAGALLGQPLTKLFSLADDSDGDFPILSALASQGRFDDQPARLRASGKQLSLAASPLTDATGRFAGFIGAARMDSDAPADADAPHERGEGDVRAAFGGRLERALRGPLGRIIANAESIRSQSDGPLRDDYVTYAADIADAGRHLLGLVEDLVDLQAIEREDFEVDSDQLDLADIARRASGLLKLRAQDADVGIDWPKDDERLPAVGEFRRALQVLVNLIGNAVRYSPAGGMVWIRVEQEAGRACVIVADQGKGIAEPDQARIFEKFERVDPKEPGGSGLGLYIARRLARAMGGDVTVDSAPGQGARFIFALPASDPD